MRKPLLVLTAAAGLGAWMRADAPLTLQPESRLWVDGTSTTKSFSCRAVDMESEIHGDPAAPTAVLAGEKAVRKVVVRVPALKLDCGNGTMNDHMRKAIKAEQFRTITFTLTGYDVVRAAEGARGTLNGTLALGGATKPVAIAATAKAAGANQLRVAGTYELAMSDFGLKAPTLMFGAMKVGDRVTVGFDLVLKSSPPALVP